MADPQVQNGIQALRRLKSNPMPAKRLSAEEGSGTVTLLLSSVTAPLSAIKRPSISALVEAVMEVFAIIVPENIDEVPRVAEVATLKKTFAALAPLISETSDDELVVNVLPIRNTKSPEPSRTSVPFSAALL
jgi:hypothetical protein